MIHSIKIGGLAGIALVLGAAAVWNFLDRLDKYPRLRIQPVRFDQDAGLAPQGNMG